MVILNSEFYQDEDYIYATCHNPEYEDFYKEKKNAKNKIWWTSKIDTLGELSISFDREKIYNLFEDYPYNMTEEEIAILKKEEPYWAKFFSWREKTEEGKYDKKMT